MIKLKKFFDKVARDVKCDRIKVWFTILHLINEISLCMKQSNAENTNKHDYCLYIYNIICISNNCSIEWIILSLPLKTIEECVKKS